MQDPSIMVGLKENLEVFWPNLMPKAGDLIQSWTDGYSVFLENIQISSKNDLTLGSLERHMKTSRQKDQNIFH